MFMKQSQLKKTTKEKKISCKLLEIREADPSKPDRTELLQRILEKHKIWDIKKRKFVSEKEKKFCEELFFAIFIAWITNNFHFPYQGGFCFVGLNNDHSLIVIPPIDKITAYINSHACNINLYKPSIFHPFCVNGRSNIYQIRLIKNFSFFNLQQMLQSEKIQSQLNFFPTDHESCSKYSVKKLEEDTIKAIIENPTLATITGGFGFIIHCPSTLIEDICANYFSEVESLEDISGILDDLLMAIIMLFYINRYCLGKIATNSRLSIKGYDPTPELDGVGYSSKNKKLVIAELTSLYEQAFHKDLTDTSKLQFPKHFEGKVETFNRIENSLKDKNFDFLYLYIHLKKLNQEMETSLHYAAVKNNKRFKFICLEKDFEELKKAISTENYTNGKLYRDFESKFKKFRENLTI